ncbi:MAG: CotH kinase family protein [Muribaculaceae bacterium]|nr:CotH kinase family protein [Muribaculaceae bacterium]
MMPVVGKQFWQVSLNEQLNNVDFYAFIESDMAPDTLNMTAQQCLDSLQENIETFRSTKLKESYVWAYNYPKWVFCPDFNLPYSDGYWRPLDSYDAQPSGTLPVIHIDTKNAEQVTTKEYYIPGTFWMDNCEGTQYKPLGSKSSPLKLEIKGRGNWTWFQSHKKPYKIKFDKKQEPLGLDVSKHFVLKVDAEDRSGYLRNETGFEVSRILNMPYTTTQRPVELIMNGEYMGLYFLCEKIRVEDGRVEIQEQKDYETDPYKITGGWLLETRGYDNPIVAFKGCFLKSESPELFSPQQQQYITKFILAADSCINVPDKEDKGIEQYIDLDSYARFYVIHEIMDNIEAFDGSLNMYKDIGEDSKLHFGPVWDFDNSFMNTTSDRFVLDYNYYPYMWIKEVVKFPAFQQKVREVWNEFCEADGLNRIKAHAYEWRQSFKDAEISDKKRWRTYASSHTEKAPDELLNLLSRKVTWLNKQWGEMLVGDVNKNGKIDVVDVTVLINMVLGVDTTDFIHADVNCDGEVDVRDLTALINMILK